MCDNCCKQPLAAVMKEENASSVKLEDAVTHSMGLYITICVLARMAQYRDQMTDLNTHLGFFIAGVKAGMIDAQKRLSEEDVFYDALEDQVVDELDNAANVALGKFPELKMNVNEESSRLSELGNKHFQRTLNKFSQTPTPKAVAERVLLYPQFNSQVLELVATNYLLGLKDDKLAKEYIEAKNDNDAMFSAVVGSVKEFTFSSGHALGGKMTELARAALDAKQMDNFINVSTQFLTTYIQIADEVNKVTSMGVSRVLPKEMTQVALGGLAQGIVDSTMHNEPSYVLNLFQSFDNVNWSKNFNLIYQCTTGLCSGVIQDYRKAYSTALQKQQDVANSINTNAANYIGENALSSADSMFDDYLLAQSVNSSKKSDPSVEDIGYLRWRACIKASTGVLSKLLYTTSHEAGKMATEVVTMIKPDILQSAVKNQESPREIGKE